MGLINFFCSCKPSVPMEAATPLRILEDKHSLSLIGPAGCGKSYRIRQLVEEALPEVGASRFSILATRMKAWSKASCTQVWRKALRGGLAMLTKPSGIRRACRPTIE